MNNEENVFRIKAYSKYELAELYNPGRTAPAALQTLYRWIQRNTALKTELENVGYNKFRHCFLRQEVALIVKYLGEP